MSGTCHSTTSSQEGPLVSHANAALTPRHRLIVARLVVDSGVPICEVAARFQVSWPTVKRWADRYRAGEPMTDRSSPPHHSPNKTPQRVVRRCVSLRLGLPEGPVQLAARLGIAPLSVTRILTPADSTGYQPAIGPPGNRSAATSTTTPAHWSMSRSGRSATSPTAAAGATSAASRATATAPRPPASPRTHTTSPRWATRSCPRSSTTTPVWPTARSTTTKPP